MVKPNRREGNLFKKILIFIKTPHFVKNQILTASKKAQYLRCEQLLKNITYG